METNRPGLCPCCKNPREIFFQSINSDGLFDMLSKRGDFKRDWLFCTPCIDWAKSEVKKCQHKQKEQYEQLTSANQAHYSPISEASANRSTPDPFNEIMHGPLLNDPVSVFSDVIGKRLSGRSDSPFHLLPLQRPVGMEVDNNSGLNIEFTPSPIEDQWPMQAVISDPDPDAEPDQQQSKSASARK